MNLLRTIALFMLVPGLSIAASKSYTLALYQDGILAGKQVTHGQYKLVVDESKAVIKGGKTNVEFPISVSTEDKAWDTTSVVYQAVEGGKKIREIRLGGTKLRIVVSPDSAGATGVATGQRPQ